MKNSNFEVQPDEETDFAEEQPDSNMLFQDLEIAEY